jgi:hypothetical protein
MDASGLPDVAVAAPLTVRPMQRGRTGPSLTDTLIAGFYDADAQASDRVGR